MTTLKIEDLDEGRKAANGHGYGNQYNPVWKLQITDDKNKV